ncbi:hypothetical protein ABT369_39620 [Dactylosporangium sp. NPDC000244]|uniref:hypothetical protein n=1 Tax=Dactylosporangium sp. NPDC000244 TaxID=3154365 RepID=UPI00332515FB
MSTNYEVIVDGEPIHLGKASGGWPFNFQGHPERGVVDYESWLALAASGRIVDEYGAEVTLAELEDVVARHRSYRAERRYHFSQVHDGQHDDARGNRFSNYEFC